LPDRQREGPPDLDSAGAAGAAHVQSEHSEKARQWLPPHLAETPKIINFEIPQDDWSKLGEMAVPGDSQERPALLARAWEPGTR
jgi:hypothetical protein